jgi:hypothetical protein
MELTISGYDLPLLVLEQILIHYPSRWTTVCKMWRKVTTDMMIRNKCYIYALAYDRIPQVLSAGIDLDFLVTVVMYGFDQEKLMIYHHLFPNQNDPCLAQVCVYWQNYLQLMMLEDFVIEQCTFARVDLLRKMCENGHIIPAHIIADAESYADPSVSSYLCQLKKRQLEMVSANIFEPEYQLRPITLRPRRRIK